MTATASAARPRASQVGNLLATQTTLATALKIVDLAAEAVRRLTTAAPAPSRTSAIPAAAPAPATAVPRNRLRGCR